MTIKTESRFGSVPTQTQGNWKITPDIEDRIDNLKRHIERAQIEFERSIQSCTWCGGPGRFIRREGVYTRGWAVFKCDNCKKEFPVG